MSGNDGNEGIKKCPFLNSWCIGAENCACSVKVTQTQMVLGVVKQITDDVCPFPAICQILSSLAPQIAQMMGQRPMKLPPQIFKGIR